MKIWVAGEVDGARSWWSLRGGGYGLNGREERSQFEESAGSLDMKKVLTKNKQKD